MRPGVDETLRVNGEAGLSDDPALLVLFAGERDRPRLVMRLHVAAAYLHCAKALMRSRLRDSAARVDRSALPGRGRMLSDQTGAMVRWKTRRRCRHATVPICSVLLASARHWRILRFPLLHYHPYSS